MQENDSHPERETQRRTVYLVYGRQTDEVKAIQEFLQRAGLTFFHKENSIELAQVATPFREDELTAAFKHAQAVIVLLTGDEKARLCKKFQHKNDQEFEKMYYPQPTPEQLFEAGYAFGTSPKRTILVQIGSVRPFSDIAGRHILHFTGTTEDYNVFRTRLRVAGCITKMDSGEDIPPFTSSKIKNRHILPDPQKVFVVHGRNIGAKSAMFAFLRALKLVPIDWGKAVELAKLSSPYADNSPYTGEAVVAGIDKAQAVVILLTGDDLVQLEKPNVLGEPLICPQARPNVLFEAGIARGRCAERTILLMSL